MTTNNVTRMLSSKKIDFQVFEMPAEKIGAQETARLLNVPIEVVFKTIVVKRNKPGKPVLAVIPGNRSVDLKLIAAAMDEKKMLIPTEREAEQITGLQAGGISPLALINKGFQVLIDNSVCRFDEIHISAGQRGLNLKIKVKDLISITHAKIKPISTDMDDSEDLVTLL